MNTLLLLLIDSRAPAGAHHHSGGMEAAVGTGLVTGPASLEDFCRARLRTSARVAAAFAAAACLLQSDNPERSPVSPPAIPPARSRDPREWAVLDAEFEARMASEAMRTASRQLGGGLARLLRSLLPEADLVTPWARCGRPAPHHPLVLGAGIALAGGSAELAARAAALAACTGPASAAVRLLGLDPFAVQAMLARLAADVDACAASAVRAARQPPSSLPSDSGPAYDLLADFHLTAEVRLFAS
jgi:urease accessory protein